MSEEKMNRTLWAGLNNPELQVAEADAVVLGLPFDRSASYRKGAARAPDRIRSISTHIPPTTEEGRLLTALKLRDLGNLEPGSLSQEAYFAEVEETAASLFSKTIPFFIGGDHSVTIPLDIDFLDPAAAPGTGTPKPGGFSTREMLELLRIFARLPIIGMDVVEVSPPFDHADITSFAAQRALTEMWGHLFSS